MVSRESLTLLNINNKLATHISFHFLLLEHPNENKEHAEHVVFNLLCAPINYSYMMP